MRNRKIIVIGAILLVAIFLIAIVMNSINDLKNLSKTNTQSTAIKDGATEPQFVKEGTLSFIASNDDTLGTIDIEIADNDAQREQGLMYRSSMKQNQGMLFVFDKSGQQNFWMKNTIISLDIIYVDENFNIVTIHKNTQPYSEAQIPSYKNAQYVIEVNAEFCNRNNIKEGDRIYSKVLQPHKVQA
ncbi:MAG: DUF192 domain-containing protein [Bacteroidia bacterium]